MKRIFRRGGRAREAGRRVLRVLLVVVAAFYLFCLLGLLSLRWWNPVLTSVQVQRRVEAIFRGESYAKRASFLPLAHIPLHLQHAVIAAEDSRFYQHSGIDWVELGKVIEKGWETDRIPRGASTITQQLVKNLFLTTHPSFIRKGIEFTLVPFAELILSKERLLELYLNVVEWGPGVFGAEAASRFHYRLPASRLTREQSARLAACLPAPLARRPQEMHRYGAEILRRMEKMGW